MTNLPRIGTTGRPRPRVGGRGQRGLSLVELMVGVTVGLFVVAAAATMVATQLADNRRLILEAQLQQDLRASLDIVTRQLRRAGALLPLQALQGLATADAEGRANELAPVTVAGAAGTREVGFRYAASADESGPFGFKLDRGVLRTRMGAGGWQDLSDGQALVVTALEIEVRTTGSATLPCARLCSDGGTGCWPTVEVRDAIVEISAHARSDPAARRTMRGQARLRNDLVRRDATLPSATACPS